jgi:hypothetical protein
VASRWRSFDFWRRALAQAEHTELTDQIKAARAAHDKLVEGLQAQCVEIDRLLFISRRG